MQTILVLARVASLATRFCPACRPGLPDRRGFARCAASDGGRYLARGSLDAMPALPDRLDAVVSVVPLDAFARWIDTQPLAAVRVIAIGSTGVRDKRASPDPSSATWPNGSAS